MVCKFCGNEIENGSDFCFICGQKVEAEAQPVADVYSQPAEQPAAEQAPVQAPSEIPYIPEPAAPAYEQPAEAPAKGKGKKKAKKPKKQFLVKRGIRFVAFLFAIIGYILYRKEKNLGNEERATEILNAIMLGLDFKLAIVVLSLTKKYMLS